MRLVDLKTRMLMADLAAALPSESIEVAGASDLRARYAKWKSAQAEAAKRGKVIGRPPTELKPEQRAILEEWAKLTPRPGLKWLALQLGLSVGKVHSLAKTVLPKTPIIGNEPVPIPPRLSDAEATSTAIESSKPFGQIFDDMERQTGKRNFEYTPTMISPNPDPAPQDDLPTFNGVPIKDCPLCGNTGLLGAWDDWDYKGAPAVYDVQCRVCSNRTAKFPAEMPAIEAWNRGETTTT